MAIHVTRHAKLWTPPNSFLTCCNLFATELACVDKIAMLRLVARKNQSASVYPPGIIVIVVSRAARFALQLASVCAHWFPRPSSKSRACFSSPLSCPEHG